MNPDSGPGALLGGRMLLAQEWISSIGGSENVFRQLMDTFPDADAICLWNDAPDSFDRPVAESRLASSRFRGKKALSLPLMPRAWRRVSLEGYGAVLASSHAFAHHLAGHAARAGLDAFAYVHTPARYIWAPEGEARGRGLVARAGSVPLKRVDRKAVDPRVRYAANSEYIRDRIRRAWDVDATVIYPPVDVERITSVGRWRDELSAEEERLFEPLPTDGFILGASRLVSYKRLDLVIEVGEALGMPVVIAGSGPDETQLKAQGAAARVPVRFTGRVSDAQLYALYQEASLFVFLPVEDFGIMPVEAMAAGAPVLVNKIGGAAESVGFLGGGAAVSTISDRAALREAARTATSVNTEQASRRAIDFGAEAFQKRIREWVGSVTTEAVR